jgi:CMP-N-acetylneuraminic acid synthetase
MDFEVMDDVAKRCIASIPSRGGSKRIPFKSLQKIGNKTLLQRCIEVAFESEAFEEVFVDTDDSLIAAEALRCGAQVPYLRKKYFDDNSPVSLATIQFVSELQKSNRLTGNDFVAQLMPNCPFLRPSTILEFVNEAKSSRNRSLLSAVKIDPIARYAFELDSKGRHTSVLRDTPQGSRTQDLQPLYVPTGAIWVSNLSYLIQEGSFYGNNHKFRVISETEGLDIDTFDQLEYARFLDKALMS